jgi:toxin YhaV
LVKGGAVVVHGWTVFAHPLFMEEYEGLSKQVVQLQKEDPVNYQKKNVTKRLAAVHKLAFDIIPRDPTLPDYRQGSTLGREYKHWFRAKFFQQYRLFFRFHSGFKIIVYVWVNDERSKRAYDSKTDAYRVFKKMLGSGNPPDDWNELLQEAKKISSRLSKVAV